ncbi:MAG TPA: PAS domain S-box protein [Pyrinomonadaceae bacterium]|nr:PAS domain S-box protein [Pyrinomonadaceae bacterium]
MPNPQLNPPPANRARLGPHDAGAWRRAPAWWARYGLALASVAAATLLTFALKSLVGPEGVRIVFIFFFPAVLVTALYGGRAPALLALALSALVGNYFFLGPTYELSLSAEELAQTALFFFVAALLVYLTHRTRDAEAGERASRESLATTLRSIGDAVIATDAAGRVTFMNDVAARLTGWPFEGAEGRPVTEVFRIVNESTREPVESPVEKVLREGAVVGLANHTVLIARDGRETPIDDSGAPILDASGATAGVVLVFRDITERRRAEEETARLSAQVEAERRRLESLVASVPGVVWEAWGEPDASAQRINFVSGYVERMLGYTVGEWLSTPNFWLRIVHPDDRERAAQEAHAIFESGAGGASRFRWVTKDGRAIHVEAQSVVILDERGRPAGMRGVTMDISGRVAAEAGLRESEERFRSLADAMPQIVWTARPDGHTDYFNRRWFEYTGQTPEQTRGWGWQPALHPDDAERSLRRWATAVETSKPYSIEYRFRRASDGQYRWHLGRAVPALDSEGRVVKWFGTATDIHDQKAAEERLRFLAEAGEILASSLDYETTLEHLARIAVRAMADYCLIDVVEDDGLIRRVATAHADPEKEGLVRELRRFPPDPARAEGVPKVLRTGKTELVQPITPERLDALVRGQEHRELLERLGLASFVIVPLISRGRTIGALTFAQTGEARPYAPADVTFAELIARRAALAMDNARLYGRSQEVNRSKDEFLAMLSHELRTPLTPVIGWTHMIRSGRLSEREVEQGLRVIDKNAQALSRLINDLLDMSSILSGKMKIDRAPVNLRAVVREAAETVRPQAEARSVGLEVSTGGLGPVNVSGDRTRLVQVFWNLLNNAVKFSRAGGLVRVSVAARDGQATVEVADDGQGIAPEFLPHVFERFRQADGSTTRAHGGLGIGLALVKSFVEAHGGRVSAASPGPGAGSRFSVSLPVLPAPSDGDGSGELAAEPSAEPCAESACRVLVVDDAHDTLELLRVVFESRGYEIEACADAEEAVRVAASSHFDIIVSDIGLPGIDGYELIRRLRTLAHLRDTPAVALTGYAAPKDAEAAAAAGFDAHVPKPVDPSALAAEVEQLLKRRAAHD